MHVRTPTQWTALWRETAVRRAANRCGRPSDVLRAYAVFVRRRARGHHVFPRGANGSLPSSSFTFYLPPSQNDWWIIIFLLITPPPPSVARRPWQPQSVFFGHPKNTGKMAFRKFYRPGYCSRQADDGLMSDRWGTTAAAGERDDVRQRAVAARRHRGPTTMKTLRPHPNVEELFYEFLVVGRPTGRK